MATVISTAARNASADAVVDRLDDGATNAAALLQIFTGGQPAGPDTAATGTMLVELVLANPAYGAAAAGSAALAGTPLSVAAVTAGVAGWFRLVDRDEAGVVDGLCRATADPDNGEELVLDNTSIALDQQVTITALPYTPPASE